MTIKRYLVLVVVTLGLFGSFFLPNMVAAVTDSRRLDSIAVIDAQSISFDADPEFDVPERLALLANSKIEILALTTGQAMEEKAAEAKAIQELARFMRGSPFMFLTEGCVAESIAASFVVDAEDPSANMIIWEFTLTDRFSNEMMITIDDETGVILKLIYRQGRTPPLMGIIAGASGITEEEFNYAASRLCEMMTDYYGIPVVFGDYTLGSNLAYYRADMYSSEPAQPMYGVVRTTGFTMNERR